MHIYSISTYVAIVPLKCNVALLDIFAKLRVHVKWLSSRFSYFFAFTAHIGADKEVAILRNMFACIIFLSDFFI